MRRYRFAVLGGTFDHLHVGHEALLSTAFRVGDEVAVGLTTDRFVSEHPKPFPRRIQPFAVRRAALARWVRRNFPRRRWRLVPLESPFGRSVDLGVDALVVSRDTLAGGRAVNRERRRLGRPSIPLVVVPLALADDLEPVSSRRVRAGRIGTDGRRLAPIRVAVSADDPGGRVAAVHAVRRVFPRARIVRETPSRAPGPVDLTVRVVRRHPSGWTAIERSPRVRLRPRVIPGSRPAELERGLVTLLRPRQ
jgi:pantetheine-phosphate adenylyltransferase